MSVPKFDTMTQFWPYYLGEHALPLNRWLHFAGTTLTIGWVIGAVVTLNPWLLIPATLSGYGFAWFGHFVFEKNRPATFTYPRWSLLCDFKMWGLMLVGRLDAELKKYNIASKAPGASTAPVA